MQDTRFNQEMFDKFCADKANELKEALQGVAKEVISDISNEYLPYLADDTLANVENRTQDIVEKLIRGQYTVEGNYLRVEEPYCSVNIKVTDLWWDNFRKELIKLMPACPKDLEIASLKNEIKMLRGF